VTAAEQPVVSAIIPAHNAERFIAEAVGSILSQTYEKLECIVVDDGSSDATASVAAASGSDVRVISQPNRGVSAARNHGADAAEGSLLAFLDADDVWLPERVDRMLKALDAEPGWDAVLSAAQVVDAELRPLSIQRQDSPLDLRSIVLCEASLVSTGSNMLIRKPAFEALGGFDMRLSTAADWALLLTLVEAGHCGYLDDPLTLYRRHDMSMSRSIDLMEHDMLLVYDELFSRAVEVPELQGIRRQAYGRLHRMIAGSYWVHSDLRGFVRNAVASVRHHPPELGHFLRFPLRRFRDGFRTGASA
jgi:glycosyltransferase involved in cell wall biosynthesis